MNAKIPHEHEHLGLKVTHGGLVAALREGISALDKVLARLPDSRYYDSLDELLWLAVDEGRHEAVRYLLKAGAQIAFAPGTPPLDALSLAISRDDEKSVEQLLPRCEAMWSGPYLVLACMHMSAKWVREILRYESNVDHVDPRFGMALHAAISRVSVPITRALINAGAGINVLHKGATPLQSLLSRADLSRPRDRQLVELLLDGEAQADLSKVSPETAARLATIIGQRSAKRRLVSER